MSVSLQVDAAGFRRAIGGLLSFTEGHNLQISLRRIILGEVGAILKACVGDTKVATQQTADRRSRLKLIRSLGLTQAPRKGDISVNAGWRPAPYGRVWVRVGKNRKFAMAREQGFRRSGQRFGRTWSERIDAAVESVRKPMDMMIAIGRRAIGLSRQSWVQIADDAGIRLEAVPGGRVSIAAITKARRAIASDGLHYPNGLARKYATNREFIIELVNRLPWGRRIELDRTLAANINARARFFEQNMARGVFEGLKSFARAYPGLEIHAN